MNASVASGPSSEMGVIGRCGRTVVISDICSSPQVSAVIRVFRQPRFLSLSVQTLVLLSRQWSLLHCCLFFAQIAPQACFTFVRGSALCGSCLVSSCGPLLRSVKSGDLELQLALYPSVSDMGRNDHGGIRRGGQFLSPASDFEDSFDSRHVLHLQKVE